MNLPGRRRDHRDRSLLRRLGTLGGQLDIPSGDVRRTRLVGILSSSLVTGQRPAVARRPRWTWWKGSTIARRMMMMSRGRGWRMGVRRLGDTAGLGTPPGAGTARGTWLGLLTLSPGAVTPWRLMSRRILTFVVPVPSLALWTPGPAAVRPVRAGPSHHRDAGSHGLGLRGFRRRGFGFRPLRLGRSPGRGTLGRKLNRLFRSVYLHGIVHGLFSFLGRLRHRCGLASISLSVGLFLRSPRLRQPVLTNETGTVLSAKWLPFVEMTLLAAKMVVIPTQKCEQPGTLGWDSADDDLSRECSSAILSTQVRLERRKHTASHVTYLPKLSPEPADELQRQSLLSSIFVFDLNAWEGHWYSEWLDSRPFTSEAKIEVNDRRMWCSAQVRLRMDVQGTQFHCVKFPLGSAGEPTIYSHCYDVLNEDVNYQTTIHWNGKAVSVTTLIFTENAEDTLQRLQWIPGLSHWWSFPFCLFWTASVLNSNFWKQSW